MDTDNWLQCNREFDNPFESYVDWEAADESNIQLDNRIDDLEVPEEQDLSAVSNVTGLSWPIQKSSTNAEKGFMMFNAMETRRYKGNNK